MLKIIMGVEPTKFWLERLQAGGVDASVGMPLFIKDNTISGFPKYDPDICYLVSPMIATFFKNTKRTDIYKLPNNAHIDAPEAITLDFLIKII